MQIINLYGGPGTGKSTTAAQIFAELKKRGINVELVTEFAKDLTWHERHKTLTDQLYILGKQHHKIFMLKDKVDYIITDSPLFLSAYYNEFVCAEPLPETFRNLVIDLWWTYDSIDIFLTRSKAYNPKGRNQTEEEAVKIDTTLKAMMKGVGIPFIECGTTDTDIKDILNYIGA